LSNSVNALIQFISLIFAVGYIVGFISEFAYDYSPSDNRHGPLGEYKQLFAPDEATSKWPHWRQYMRNKSFQLVVFMQQWNLGSIAGPVLLTLVGLYTFATSEEYRQTYITIGGNAAYGLIVWVALSFLIFPVAQIVGRFVGKITSEFAAIRDYLAKILLPAIGYMVGYIVIIIFFAGAFQLANDWAFCNGRCFRPEVSETILDPSDFFYLSVSTITSLGYGHSFVLAEAPLAKGLVVAEVMAGVVWTLVVFAALVAYLTPRLEQWRSRSERSESIRVAADLSNTQSERIETLLEEVSGAVQRMQEIENAMWRGDDLLQLRAGPLHFRLTRVRSKNRWPASPASAGRPRE
jgi:Ion channel